MNIDFGNFKVLVIDDHPGMRTSIESSALEDLVSTNRLLNLGAAMGIQFALDDFGTGYSSMNYLRQLPVRFLKIDRSFIRDMLNDPEDMAIVEAILGLAAAFRLRVIAEGVETTEQILMLTELECPIIQGYSLARPMPSEQIHDWVSEFRPDPKWALNAKQHLLRDDFQLIMAEIHHRHWLNDLLSWTKADPSTPTKPPSLDHHKCDFGRWYDMEGSQRYGQLEQFQAVESLHAEVHTLAHQVYELHKRRDTEQRLRAEARLLEASDAFIDTLIQLRRAVSQPSIV